MSDRPQSAGTPSVPQSPTTQSAEKLGLSRRGFLRGVGGAAAVTAGMGTFGAALAAPQEAEAALIGPYKGQQRRQAAWALRKDAAQAQKQSPQGAHPTNSDEDAFADRRGSYSKGLPHNHLGEVDQNAYRTFLAALESGDPADFEAIPMGGNGRLVSPQSAYTYSMAGADSHRLGMPAAPALTSAREASEMTEVYWQAVTRDVPFTDWGAEPLTVAAAADLSNMGDFRGPKAGGQVTPGTLFRGGFGDLQGPYLSQFLWQTVPFGIGTIEQQYFTPVNGDDYMTSYGDWLAVQRGILPAPTQVLRPYARYISTGRDLGEYVHRDFSFQAYMNAALICLSYGDAALDPANPYVGSASQYSFVTFGGPDILDLVAQASQAAFKAAWFQKWLVHRRLRPEAFGGRVHNQVTGAKNYGIHADLLNSPVLSEVFSQHGTYLLPMAFPEGSPTHPAYPAGHATVAGACVTILKAYFNEDFVIPNPVEADATGSALNSWNGGDLALGDELDKLGVNIALGRDYAGVHWRTDGTEGMRLGEQVAIELLRDAKVTYNEDFGGFTLRKFDGSTITI